MTWKNLIQISKNCTVEPISFKHKRCIDCGELLPNQQHYKNHTGRCLKCHAKHMGELNRKVPKDKIEQKKHFCWFISNQIVQFYRTGKFPKK